MSTVCFHTSKNNTWRNASGDEVPYKFVPEVDKKKETLSAKILKQALQAEATLQNLYDFMTDAFAEITTLVKQEYEIKKGKSKKTTSGFTWYNFDKSVKVESTVDEIVKWDETLSSEAYQILKEYIQSALTGDKELISGLVSEAFANSKGMIDTRKVFQIIKWGRKIKSAKYQKACELLTQAQGIDKTKLYMRVWVKEDDGSYRNINLNFSSI